VKALSDLSYTSKYNFTDALRPDGVQPGFAKIDAALSLNGPDERWNVSLIGRNLTNKLVVGAANDLPFTGGTGGGTAGPGVTADMSAFVDNPREIFVELGFKF
jgi:iron complex outermembrane receptor protein